LEITVNFQYRVQHLVYCIVQLSARSEPADLQCWWFWCNTFS